MSKQQHYFIVTAYLRKETNNHKHINIPQEILTLCCLFCYFNVLEYYIAQCKKSQLIPSAEISNMTSILNPILEKESKKVILLN